MRKLLITTALIVMILSSVPAVALASPDTPSWGSQVNPSQCEKVGGPVVNVTQRVVNSIDSGVAGNYWAFSHHTRHIQVWASSTPGSYCALVSYEGHFDAQAGQTSPGGGYTLDGDEDGTFQGGYRATITGTLLNSPTWRTRGNVGTTDYACDLSGNCPGAVNWIVQYFAAGYGFTYEWWGWVYHAGRHGEWVNSSDGNSGDIN